MGAVDTAAPGAERGPDAAARRRRWSRSSPARGPSRTRSTRRSATGSPTPTTHYCFGTAAGPHPFPLHGARLPARHRSRGPGPDPGAGTAACRMQCPRASVADPTRSACSTRSSPTPGVRPVRLPRRPATAWRPAGTPRRSPVARRAPSRGPTPTCCRTRTAQTIESHSISSGFGLSGRRSGACATLEGRRSRRRTAPVTDTEAMERVGAAARDPRASSRPSKSPHAVAGALSSASNSVPGSIILIEPARAAATRTSRRRRSGSACSTARDAAVTTSGLAGLFETLPRGEPSGAIGYLPTGYPRRPDVDRGDDGRRWNPAATSSKSASSYRTPGWMSRRSRRQRTSPCRWGCGFRDALTAGRGDRRKAGGRAVVMTYWNPVLK